MIIRKKFEFNGQHIVRNCSSIRCKKSIHGHTYQVEVFFTASDLDNGGMILDFGLMKGNIKDIIKAFHNSYSIWNKEDEKFKDVISSVYDRIVSLPVSPSAENYSLMLLYIIDNIIKATEFNNGEKAIKVKSVRVHETLTGYAESFRKDLKHIPFDLNDIKFSQSVTEEFEDKQLYNKILKFNKTKKKQFKNKKVVQQVK
jgi:6-pyruvoyltetrahydropterin/6-carboxytetrahydropterin synthase